MKREFGLHCGVGSSGVSNLLSRIFALLLVGVNIGLPVSLNAEPCQLYPLALSSVSLSNAIPGVTDLDAYCGSGAGQFGWLSWGGSPAESVLVGSLKGGGGSLGYINPDHPDDRLVSVGDWVSCKPGVSNSKRIREALDALLGEELTLPIWDQTRGVGDKCAYHVSGFATVRLLNYQLPQQNRIAVRFLGYVICGEGNAAPRVEAGTDQTIGFAMSAMLSGVVSDDGLPEGSVVTVSWSKVAGSGSVSFDDPTAAVTLATFSEPGTYVLRLTATDSELSASDELVVTVNRENQAPIAHDQAVVTDEDVAVTVTLTGSDSDGDPLAFVIVGQPAYGQLSGTPPAVIYTPKPDYNGPDVFTFRVSDGELDSSVAIVSVTNRPVNDAPVADGLMLSGDEDSTLEIPLSGSDIEGSPLFYEIVSGPAHGSLSGSAPNVVYTPAGDFNGNDALTFRVNDGELDSAPAVVMIEILSVNDAPVVEAGQDQFINLPTSWVSLEGEADDVDFFDASSLITAWHLVGGPGPVQFGNSNAVATTATFSTSGLYTLRLTASDGFLQGDDELVVTVNAPPMVSAGEDLTITYPASVHLTGYVSDDGIPENMPVEVAWSKVSGPGAVHFTESQHTNTTASFSEGGVHVLRLTATDTAAEAADDITVTVNKAPLVDAGSDTTITNLTALLGGSVDDDGIGEITVEWSKLEGPGTVLFSTNAPAAVATFSGSGYYTLRLTASDSYVEVWDEVFIEVDGAPAVDAGEDQTITVLEAQLAGTVADDGLPAGGALTVSWSKVSGPGNVHFESDAAVTTATFDQAGIYVLRLTAHDGLASASDDLVIRVDTAPVAQSQSVTTPEDVPVALLLQASDGDGDPLSFRIVSPPLHGTLLGMAPDITYLPSADYAGEDAFAFVANDGVVDSAPAIVTVMIQGLNDAPVFVSHPVTNAVAVPRSSRLGAVDLGTWSVVQYGPWDQGPANWVRSQSNTVALQTLNADASILLSDFSMFRDEVEGTFLAQSSADDDYLGFVFGYQDASHYYLFDWKKVSQDKALVGMNVKVVADDPNLSWGGDTWATYPALTNRVRNLYHNSIPYQFGVEYRFLLRFSPGDISILVYEATNLLADIRLNDTSYPEGRFGFYNFSQDHVRYAGFVQEHLYSHTYLYDVDAVDPDGDVVFYALDAAPAGMAINPTNGVIEWFPGDSDVGSVAVTVRAMDPFGASSLQSFELTVPPVVVNKPPFVDAGPDRSFTPISDSIILHGTVADDGVPTDQPLAVQWSLVAGPGSAEFADPTSTATSVSFDTPGVYVLQLQADDTMDVVRDYVRVRADVPCSVSVSSDLVAWWTANFTFQDEIGSALAIVHGDPELVSGKVGAAFRFSKAGDFIAVPASDNLDLAADPAGFTVEFWMRPEAYQYGSVLGWANGVRLERYNTSWAGAGLRWYVGAGGDYVQTTGPVWSADNWNWTHVALTYHSGLARIYIDGVLNATANVGSGLLSTSGDFHLGQVPGSANFFPGRLDEISLYRRALDPEEVQALFTSGAAGKCPSDGNAAPWVYAGPDIFVSGVPGEAMLAGEVLDDGFPLEDDVHPEWSLLAGPGSVVFENVNALTTHATFSTNGVYVLQLTADDGEAIASDLVEVRVEALCTVDEPVALAAWWPANGTDADVVNEKDSLRGSGVGFAGGRVASAFRFDGLNDFVWVPSDPCYDVGGSADGFSLELWMKPEAYQAGSVLGWADGVRLERCNVSWTGAGLRCYLGGDGSYIQSSRAVWAAANWGWTHVAVTYEAGEARLYVNGALDAVTKVGTNLLSTASDFHLGNVPGSGGYYPGLLDEISLYRRALNPQEIQSLFVSGSAGKCPYDENAAPRVYAGPDLILDAKSEPGALNGLVSDDGLPAGSTLRSRWSVISGPGAASFSDFTSPVTSVSFDADGLYVLQLAVDDGEAIATDVVEVRVGLPCTVLDPPGLVGWWSANGTSVDKVSGVDAVLGSGTAYGDGKVAGAFQFDGVNDFAWVPAQSGHDLGSAASGFSLECWMKPGAYQYGSVLGWANGVRLERYNISWSGAGLRCYLASNGYFVQSAGAIWYGTDWGWTHVVLTYSSGDARLYVNGVLNATSSVGTNLLSTAGDFYLGQVPGSPNYYNGSLDEVSLYSRALEPWEVQSLYSAGAAGKCVSPHNAAPVVFAGSDRTLLLPTNSVNLKGSVMDDGLPAGAELTLAWEYLSGPCTVFFSTTNAPLTVVTFTNAGVYEFALSASDGELTAKDTVTVTVLPDTRVAPAIAISSPANGATMEVVSGGTVDVSLMASASDIDGVVTSVVFLLDGTPVGARTSPPWLVAITNLPAATYELSAIAVDNTGLSTTSAPVRFTVYVDEGPPVVELIAPEDAAFVTAPTRIFGTANSPILESFAVRYRFAAPDSSAPFPWVNLVTGSSPIVSNTLAVFDPTMLLNGIYQLQVIATDFKGRAAASEIQTVMVSRNLKIGHFALSFTDLRVPLVGVPIEIVRTYDSRDHRLNDFGVGWSLGMRNVRLQKTRNLGANWSSSSGSSWYVLDSIKPRRVTVTIGDRAFEFESRLTPSEQFGAPIASTRMTFTNLPGTYGTLEIDGDNLADVSGFLGYVDLVNLGDGAYFNPTRFRFTSAEGDVYIIDEAVGLESLTDRNGNTLTITTNGIFHSSGLSVAFERDAEGRIQAITDPMGNVLHYDYGTNGLLSAFIDRETNTTTYAYTNIAFPHYLTAITDPRGVKVLRTEFDDSGRMVRQIDADNNVVEFMHDLASSREVIRDRLGHVTVHEYDDRGNVTRTTDALGHVTRYQYDLADNQLETVDALGHTNRFTYDSSGNRLTETDPVGATTRYTYGTFREVTSVRDPRGALATNTYHSVTGNLLEQRDALGNVTRYTYDTAGNTLTRMDALGNVVSNRYDQLGHITNTLVLDASGAPLVTTAFSYDANGNPLSKTVQRTTSDGIEALTTRYRYDQQDRLIHTIRPDGSTNSVIFAAGLDAPAVEIDPLGQQTVHEYDLRGQETNTVFPDGSFESVLYDAEGRKMASVDRAGRKTWFTNDALGRLVGIRYPDGTSETAAHDPVGRLILSTDANGNPTAYGFDPAGRVVVITNALGQVSLLGYDASGNRTVVVDALGRTNRFVYDGLGRRVQWIFPDQSARTTWFDALGRRTHEQDQAGRITAFAYDGLSRLTSVTNAQGYVTSYQYDEVGNLRCQTDANGHTTWFEYDPLGRRIKRTLPGGQVESYAYNCGGLLTNRIDFNGYSTAFLYDGMNRLQMKVPDPRRGEPAVRFGYDVLGLRTNMTDASGVTAYEYDVRGRLITKATPQGTLNYGYDANGNVTNIASLNESGTSVGYEYDALNRLGAVNDEHLGRTAYTYDAVGNLQACTYPNGVNTYHEYDSLNRLTNVASSRSLTLLANYAYVVGAAGNRLAAAETMPASVLNPYSSTISRVYEYDDLYRLMTERLYVDSQLSTLGYSYDPAGNRLSRSVANLPLPPQSFGFDLNDRLTSDSYDANGNTLFSAGHGQIQADWYDFENRLTQRTATLNGQPATIHITYDGDGNRVRKMVVTASETVTTHYLVDNLNPTGYAQVLEEHRSIDHQASTLDCTYTYGHNLISQDRLNGTQWVEHYYGYDGHDNVRYLTDEGGSVTDAYSYDAFGNLLAASGDTENCYLFTGEQFDPDLGLYYLRARYHDPDTGRFWTQDGFEGFQGDPLSLHKYTYCGNDPVNGRDPTGQFTLVEVQVANSIASSVNAMAADAGADTILRGHRALAEAGLAGPEAQEAIQIVLYYQLFSDLYAGYNLGKLAATLSSGALAKLQKAWNRLRQLSPADWVKARLFAPKGVPKIALGRVAGEFDAFNPGPLSDELAGTFSGGRYAEIVLESDTVLYRAGSAGKPLGQFYDVDPPQGVLQSRIDKAILPKWPGGGTSPIDSVIAVKIPKGTKVYVGQVSSQGGVFIGGTLQVVVPSPWKILGVKVETIKPLL